MNKQLVWRVKMKYKRLGICFKVKRHVVRLRKYIRNEKKETAEFFISNKDYLKENLKKFSEIFLNTKKQTPIAMTQIAGIALVSCLAYILSPIDNGNSNELLPTYLTFFYNLFLSYLSGYVIYIVSVPLPRAIKAYDQKEQIQEYKLRVYDIARNFYFQLNHHSGNVTGEFNTFEREAQNIASKLSFKPHKKKIKIKNREFTNWLDSINYAQNETELMITTFNSLDNLLDNDGVQPTF